MLTTFLALKPITLDIGGRDWSPPVVKDKTAVRLTDLFICAPAYITQIKDLVGDEAIQTIDLLQFAKSTQLPICLNPNPRDGQKGHSLLPVDDGLMELVKRKALDNKRTVPRIALLNGLGGALGDSLVGVHAIRLGHQLLQSTFGNVTLDVITAPSGKADHIWDQAPMVADRRTYPMPLTEFREYDGYFDFSLFERLYGCYELPWPDFQYEALGIDSQLIPSELKAISWIPKGNDTAKWITRHLKRTVNSDGVYVQNSTSNVFKEAPPEYLTQILTAIVRAGNHLITEDTGVYELACSLGYSCLLVTCACPSESIELIRSAKWAVCTDTYALHLAACSKTPTIGIFTIWPSTLIAPYQLNISAVDIDPVGDFRGAMERKGWSLEDPDTKARLYEKWSESWPKLEEKIKSFIDSMPPS